MRKYPKNRYVPGSHKEKCDMCSWDYLSHELSENHKGFRVCDRCYDPKPDHLKKKSDPRKVTVRIY